MMVNTQGVHIDRIEYYFSEINENIKKTNDELLILPAARIYSKNKIIYGLTIILGILITLSLIKIAGNRRYNKTLNVKIP